MKGTKRPKKLNLPEDFLYQNDTRVITYTEFVKKELVYFNNTDNVRSTPSLVDGLRPCQRKVLFACFKQNDKRKVKMAHLAGSIGERIAYHHSEVPLMSTIIHLARNFIAS